MFLFHIEKLCRGRSIANILILVGVYLLMLGRLQAALFNGYTLLDSSVMQFQAVTIGDVNNDGRNDVIAVTTSLYIFYQTPTGQLADPVTYPIGDNGTSIAVADFNGDGRNDIVVGKQGGGLRVFWQDAGGGFANFTDIATSFLVTNCVVRVGDLNNDGLPDLAVMNLVDAWSYNLNASPVDVFLQTNHTLVLSHVYLANYFGYNDCAIGDVNNDGLDDIVVMNGTLETDGTIYFTTNLSVLLQTPGGFAPQANYTISPTIATRDVAIGDIDGDGLNEVLLTYGGNSDGRLAVFHQTNSGTLALSATYPSYGIPRSLAVADIDLDGRPDVVVFHEASSELGVYVQTNSASGNTLAAEQLFAIPFIENIHPQSLAVGDINGDGKPDVIIAGNAFGLVVMTNCIPGTYHGIAVSPASGFTIAGPVGGPFNTVSPTFVVTNLGGGRLKWSLNNTSTWLTVPASSGWIAAKGSTNVGLLLAASVYSLPAGVYSGTLVFSASAGMPVPVPFTLSIGQPIISNGGFEAGSFTNWTESGQTGSMSVVRDTNYVHSGTFGTALGPYGTLGYLNQLLNTLPGQAYLLSFWLRNPVGSAPNQFQVQWNGAQVFSLANLTNTAWTNLNFVVTATNYLTPLQFGFEDDSDYLALDDVTVTPFSTSFQSATRGTNSFQLAWHTVTGLNYLVQYKTNLLQPAWINLGSPVQASTNTLTLTDTNAALQRFYRLSVVP